MSRASRPVHHSFSASTRRPRRGRASAASLLSLATAVWLGVAAQAADVVPTDIQLPGTQPGEVGNLDSPDKCDNCHGGYDVTAEPGYNWRGSMMALAGRDPIFWATLAVVEQDFNGAGDLCIRCHSTAGWQAGHSLPTDGSGLQNGDADGVECDFCHTSTDPDDSQHLGEQYPPFVANDGGVPPVGYYGSGMSSLWAGSEKLGPYANANPKHQFLKSGFHRSVDFCGVCHDVSNSAVGDLAHNHGAQAGAPAVVASGVPGAPVEEKAAFNNFPYQYGIVERTFSEYKSGQLVQTLVSDYGSLPSELQAGAIQAARDAALLAGTGGNYEDGTLRYFSCQTCHMRPVEGHGCNKSGALYRYDLPVHDLTGGNFWMPEAILYLDGVSKLRLGGGLNSVQTAAMNDGILRAKHQLDLAAALEPASEGVGVRVTNLTGHKLITGYPEGRRMWLNVKWYDDGAVLLREDGAYGPLFDGSNNPVEVVNPASGQPVQVQSILDLDATNTKIYEAHYGLTQEWASQLRGLGYPADLPLSFDRLTGAVDTTLDDLATSPPGTTHEAFHFAINNTVIKDNRIPTYGMRYDDVRIRNALPVPPDQYGDPGPGGVYEHWDEVALSPPVGAVSADVELLYQPTSWEYIQFLALANEGTNAFLAEEGTNMLEAWLNTGMAPPYTMASTTIAVPEPSGRLMLGCGLIFLIALGRRRTRP